MELKTPASRPQKTACSRPNHASAAHVTTPTTTLVKIWTRRKRPILVRDVVDDFEGDLLLGQRWAELDELPPEHLVGEQAEVSQKQNHEELIERAEHADRARPQQACRRDGRVFHLHADNARFGLGGVVLRKLLGSLLDLFERTGFLARPTLEQRRDAARASRQLVDDRQRLVLERIGASQDRSERQKIMSAAPIQRGTRRRSSASTAGSSA